MKKNYIEPRIKVVAVKIERIMNDGSKLGIFKTQASSGQKAWGKEEDEDNETGFGW